MLQCSDDGVAGAFENWNDPAFAPVSILGASSRHIATDPRDDAVAVHRCARIFCGYEDIRLTRFFWDQKAVARLMDRQLPGDEIGFGRKNVTVFANANDLAAAFQIA